MLCLHVIGSARMVSPKLGTDLSIFRARSFPPSSSISGNNPQKPRYSDTSFLLSWVTVLHFVMMVDLRHGGGSLQRCTLEVQFLLFRRLLSDKLFPIGWPAFNQSYRLFQKTCGASTGIKIFLAWRILVVLHRLFVPPRSLVARAYFTVTIRFTRCH